MSGIDGRSPALLFDPDFSQPEPSPPFNWALTSSTVGLAERQPGGRLHVIFYGQEDGALARQLLVLPPGRYHLSMRLRGGSTQAKALNWNLTCPGAQEALASVPLDLAASRGLTFEVPANCPANGSNCPGSPSDLPQAGRRDDRPASSGSRAGRMLSRARQLVAPLYLFLCLILGGSAQGIWGNMVLQLLGLAIIAWAATSRAREPIVEPARQLMWIAILGIAVRSRSRSCRCRVRCGLISGVGSASPTIIACSELRRRRCRFR